LGNSSARFEREPLMNSTLTPLGLESRTWNGVEIQRRPTDGYVNATAMCKANGREWFTYARAERTKEYIAALATVLGSPQNCGDLIQTITTGPNHIRGTWVHPQLAVDLARWISPAFAVWMDGWFLESLTPRLPKPVVEWPHFRTLPRLDGGHGVDEAGGAGVNVPGAGALSDQLTAFLDAYTMHMKAEFELEAASLRACGGPVLRWRSPRFAAKCFLEWFVANHGQLAFASAHSGTVMAAVAAPPRPPAPAPAAPAPSPRPVRHHQRPPAPPLLPQPVQRHHGFRPGDLITGPELAHLLGLDAHTINKWATARSIGAERNGWRLIGRGKLAAGKQCSVYPPGCASWLFMKL
jgi:hypothetical protein